MEKALKDVCESEDDLMTYLEYKAKNHKCYKWYHSLNRIENTIETKSIYLSTGANWNDVIDRESFNSKENEILNFGLCLSFSKSENVAMWMLYGGMEKNGALLDINQGLMNQILREIDFVEIGFFKDNQFYAKKHIDRNDISIRLVDVLYYDQNKDNETFTVKRSEESHTNVSPQVLNQISFCKKPYPWHYENECRLIATLDKRIVLEDSINTMRLLLSDEVVEALRSRIFHAPNYKGEVTYQQSNLTGKIDWDLCKTCNRLAKDRND